ncbi:MAG: hypothetical protein LBU62_10445 [Bacteroidales bacterium]|jgi:phenylacetate-coenzyme A ligase PaaK-like adenylate-forming protein|nr:hypothetical protein [Bacteroidales bacterium]
MKKIHLYNGKLADSFDLDAIEQSVLNTIGKTLPTELLLHAAENLYLKLKTGDAELEHVLTDSGLDAGTARETVTGLAEVFSKSYIQDKIVHELGRIDPFVLRRFNMEDNILEGYKPLGVLCHVAAGNAPGLGALSVLEGLMTGNINIVKLSSKENGFSAILLQKLVQEDATGTLAQFVYALDISSADKNTLSRVFDFVSGIVAWGGTDAIDSITKMTQTPVVAWGHHISFGYITRKGLTDKNLLGIAKDICDGDQQACSSPQCLYYEGTYEELHDVAERLKKALAAVSPQFPPVPKNIHEEAQITSSNLMRELNSCVGEEELVEADDHSFRIYVNRQSGLEPSPLFRTIWLKPMKRTEIVRYLQPMSRYLQTVSLGCVLDEIYELSELFATCGVTRIVECGSVSFSYPGEPHDGVFALQRYCRRVSLTSSAVDKIASFDHLKDYHPVIAPAPIADKDDFMRMPASAEKSKLFVKSGGSSGKTILSSYSYRDYHFEMAAVAETLIAVGIEPKTDKIMNLFFEGHLYGGFISYNAILEFANAKNYPMGGHAEPDEMAEKIVELGINVLLGMPTSLLQLFREQEQVLKKYGGIKKIYYGGEFMSAADKTMLKEKFGVETVASLTYGSNDVGPIGYACEHCTGGVHHLLTGIMDMEIVQPDKDAPVEHGETGRIILSPKFREGHGIMRYEIGDLGRWVDGDCACGRKNPRFELMGRYGDIVRVGSSFYNYMKLAQIIQEHLEPTQLQLVIGKEDIEVVTFRVGHHVNFTEQQLIETLAAHEFSINEAVTANYLKIKIEKMNENDMEYTAANKLKHIVDRRLIL